MKIILDTSVYLQNGVTNAELYLLMALHCGGNYEEALQGIIDKGYITRNGKPYGSWELTEDGYTCVNNILLDSDKAVPDKDRCMELASKLKELFPQGIKTGSTPWRGNNRDVALRLQKFFKLYGNTWTNDEIYEATRKYVEHFNGDYTYMRTLKYFIMKSEKKTDEEGNSHIEDISELANWLENDTEAQNTNWLTNMV